jgi:uncharacterized delta-60 repeat protein
MKTKFSFYRSVLIALCLALLFFSVTLAASGGLDTTFSDDGKIIQNFGGMYHYGWDVAVQPDGKVVVVGDKVTRNNGSDFVIARYTTTGILDKTFSGDGLQSVSINKYNEQAYAVAIQADGKIVVGGVTLGETVGLARLNANGTLDTTFGVNGKVSTATAMGNSAFDLALQGNKIVMAGYLYDGTSYDGAVYQYNSDGSLDTTFNGNGILPIDFGQNEALSGIAVYAGKIYVAGSTSTADQVDDFIVARINANGTLDSTFGVGGKVKTNLGGDDSAHDLAISAGKVVVVGTSNKAIAIVRYTAAGKLDTTFGVGGKIRTNLGLAAPYLAKVAIQSNGKIVAVGHTDILPNDPDALLVRYTAAGKLDTTFGTGGKVVTDWGGADRYSSVLIKNSRIYVVGMSDTRFIIARYLP